MVDPLRVTQESELDHEANRYFVKFYTTFAEIGAGLEAREHTAQVQAEVRMEREERFRSAELPILFCSPTMELGVDIAQLNVVNMRNVPPTPANYASAAVAPGGAGNRRWSTPTARGSAHTISTTSGHRNEWSLAP